MRRLQWTAVTMAAALSVVWRIAPSQTDTVAKGRTLYLRHCAVCHGATGKGDGPLAKIVAPPVPDLTEGVFKLRSTPSGTLPTDDDLRRVIGDGIAATAMFGVKELLSDDELNALVAFVKTLCPQFRTKGSGTPITIKPVAPSPELVALGRQVYAKFQCAVCHGTQGDGNGVLAKTLRDSKGRPVRLLSLRDARHYKNGFTPADIYRTLMTGMDGTPMPSFAGAMSEREAWALAHFVHSLITNNPPPPRSGLNVAASATNPLPSAVDEEAWDNAPVATLLLQSLWRDNKPDAVRVQALTDGDKAALRLQWDDPTCDDTGARRDAVAVQMPVTFAGVVPSLFWGDQQAPVRVVQWTAGKGVSLWQARGITDRRPLPAPDAVAEGRWQNGRWTVVLQTKLPQGCQRVPFAVSVWDGNAGDDGERRSTTGWHWLTVAVPLDASHPHN